MTKIELTRKNLFDLPSVCNIVSAYSAPVLLDLFTTNKTKIRISQGTLNNYRPQLQKKGQNLLIKKETTGRDDIKLEVNYSFLIEELFNFINEQKEKDIEQTNLDIMRYEQFIKKYKSQIEVRQKRKIVDNEEKQATNNMISQYQYFIVVHENTINNLNRFIEYAKENSYSTDKLNKDELMLLEESFSTYFWQNFVSEANLSLKHIFSLIFEDLNSGAIKCIIEGEYAHNCDISSLNGELSRIFTYKKKKDDLGVYIRGGKL